MKRAAKAVQNAPVPPVRVGLISLGCAKNLVDAEIMLGALMQGGVEITNDATSADVVIVNTCSFIDSAQEESVDAILESADVREKYQPHQGLIVSGCLSQRYREDLPKLLPEVDAFMGIDQVAQVTDFVRLALSRRAERLAQPAKPKRSRAAGAAAKVVATLAAAEPAAGGHDHADHAAEVGRDAVRGRVMMTPPAGPVPAAAPGGSVISVNLRPTYIPDYQTPRFRLTPRHFAYVKIAEGCNHPCSFCTIPRMRGSHRSRAQADIVKEARLLLKDGVRELNLISQDSTYYGLDLRPNHSRAISSPEKFTAATRALPTDATTLSSLLRELNALPGKFWIRLLYTHPAHWTDELIATIAACPKVARYVDMPLQHIDDAMLQRMRRETDGGYIRDLIVRLRAGIPGLALRTTFIVGFPGETEEHFGTLLDFIEQTRFERLGVFTYSKEDGTVAGKMTSQVPARVRAARRDRAMKAQREVARDISGAAVGTVRRVLVEGEATAAELAKASVSSWEHGLIRGTDAGLKQLRGRYLVARGEADAPDIDGRVYVRGDLPVGEFAEVRIIGHTDYDLIGEPA